MSIIVDEETKLNTELEKATEYDFCRDVPAELKTKKTWVRKLGRKVIPKVIPRAIVTGTDEDNRTFQVRYYSEDQTKKCKPPSPVTKARWDFEFLFTELAKKSKLIKLIKNKWITLPEFMGETGVAAHLCGHDHGIFGGEKTRFVALDIDLHIGNKWADPAIFMNCVRVLLDYFHAKFKCHVQIKDKNAGGVHIILLLPKKEPLDQATEQFRNILQELDAQNPGLKVACHEAGMKTIGEIEIYPSPTNGFRLPLADGRTVLLDKPLALVPNKRTKKSHVQDVEEYVKWVGNKNRQYMPVDQAMQYITARLYQPTSEELHIPKEKVKKLDKVIKPANMAALDIRNNMGHLIRQWLDGDLPVGTWPKFSTMLLRLFWADGSSKDDAVEIIMAKLLEIPNRDFSTRLLLEQFDELKTKLFKTAETIWPDNGGQENPEASTETIQQTVTLWHAKGVRLREFTGFYLNKPPTILKNINMPDFPWTCDQLQDIQDLATLLKCSAITAGNILLTILEYLGNEVKYIAGKSLPYMLQDYPVKLGYAQKRSDFLKFLKERKFLETVTEYYYSKRQATEYAVGNAGLNILQKYKRICPKEGEE